MLMQFFFFGGGGGGGGGQTKCIMGNVEVVNMTFRSYDSEFESFSPKLLLHLGI